MVKTIQFDLPQELIEIENRINKPRKSIEPFWSLKSSWFSSKLWFPNESEIQSKINILTDCWTENKHIPIEEKIEQEYNFEFEKPIANIKKILKSKGKRGKSKSYRTLKLRLLVSEKQTELLEKWSGYQRWFYNCALDITNQAIKDKQSEFAECFSKKGKEYSMIQEKMRDYIKHYTMDTTQEVYSYPSFQRKYVYNYDPERFSWYFPDWISEEKKMEKKAPYERIIRGGVKRFVAAFNSALTNRQRKHNTHFEMKRQTKKDLISTIFFDSATGRPEIIPSAFGDVNAWYSKGRTKINLLDLELNKDSSFTIIHDKLKKKYFLTVPKEYIALDENQVSGDVIALDPGVRCFQSGYSPTKGIFEFSNNNRRIWKLLEGTFRLKSLLDLASSGRRKKILQRKLLVKHRRIKNLTTDLHKKTASYLVKNFSTILLPEFRTQQMVKGKISRRTKSLLNIYRFFCFKEFLFYKCYKEGKKLLIVDESYTSQTCRCGELTKTSLKVFKCSHCGFSCDRDHLGARNILIKNIKRM